MSNFIAYAEAKDPAAVRPLSFDWAPQLADGVTIANVSAQMIAAAGCQFASPVTLQGSVSRVYLSGGNPGEECVFELTATTSDPLETIIFGFGIRIADAASRPSDAEMIKADIATLKAARMRLLAGEMVREVWRNGRRLIFGTPTNESLNAAIAALEADLNAAVAQSEGRPRRAAIALAWPN